jgi:hypothetical protein
LVWCFCERNPGAHDDFKKFLGSRQGAPKR